VALIEWGKAIALGLATIASPILAETAECPTPGVSVEYSDGKDADLVCAAVADAVNGLALCELPALPARLHIEIVDGITDGCVGLYHCGEAWIEVLSPSAMTDRRDPDGAFGFLDDDAYFKSVVVHEVTHAATADVPCPIRDCVVSDEYVAYAMQILSLRSDGARSFAEHPDDAAPAPSGDLNGLFLRLAPDRFARAVWDHLARRDDPCAFIRGLTDRTILLDRERF
jgi:hypothetical protein